MPSLPQDLPECMVFLLGKAYQKVHHDFKQRLKPYGLTNLQHLVLEALWFRPGQTATELCNLLLLDKATLSGVLERMARAGWIYKYPHSENKRVQVIYASSQADKIKASLIQEREASNQEVLSRFSQEDQAVL